MITEALVLKTLVEVMNDKHKVDSDDVIKKLGITQDVLIKYLEPLRQKQYTIQVLEDITLTEKGLRAYRSLL